jgi:nucleoside phosphorylase
MERLHRNARPLFEAGYDHSTRVAICAYYNSDRMITQSDYSSDSPSIHYGLIASGNRVIRDRVTRERLRKELNVLCFETEAARLMDNFPCVVIRGIYDYPGSHKNNR